MGTSGFRTLPVRSIVLATLILFALLQLVSCGHKRSHNSSDIAGVSPSPAGSQATGKQVDLAATLAKIDATPAPKGVSADRWASLTVELKRLLTARATVDAGGKKVLAAPTGPQNAVTDLKATANPVGTQATLTWTEVLPGDCDDDGSVDISDLRPFAVHFGETSSGPGSPAYLADVNGDGQVTIADLQPIASNYSAHLQGYQVWRGHWNGSSTDWETTFRPNIGDPASTAFSADRPLSPSNARPAYTYTDDITGLTDKADVRYKVVAFGDGAAGAESNQSALPWHGGLADAPWPKRRGDSRNTGQSPYVAAQTSHLLWSTPIGSQSPLSPARSSPAVGADGTVYVGSGDGKFYAFDGASGATKWTYIAGGPVLSSPAIGADGTVYFGSDDQYIYALNPSDGSVKWRFLTKGPVRSPITISANGMLYVGSDDSYLYMLDSATGTPELNWQYSHGHQLESDPAIGADGTLYISDSGLIDAIDSVSGLSRWARLISCISTSSPSIGPDGTVFVGAYAEEDRRVYALDPADGSVKWAFKTGRSIICSPAIGRDGTVYIGSRDGYLYAFNPDDGRVLWSFQAGEWEYSSPAIGADGTIYACCGWTVYALNPTNGSVKWSYLTGNYIYSSPAIGTDGTVYVTSEDGSLYAFGGGPQTWSVGGKVTTGGVPLPRVNVTLSPGGLSGATLADGS